jgi:hypothetical protein
MLQKSKEYDQTRFSCRQVIVNGETWYRIEPLTEGTVEQEEPEKSYPVPTIEERVEALEGCLLEVISG